MDKNNEYLFTSRMPKPTRIEHAKNRLQAAKDKYWRNRLHLVDTNFDKFTRMPVVPYPWDSHECKKGSLNYWWRLYGEYDLSSWVRDVYGNVEKVRCETGGAGIPRYASLAISKLEREAKITEKRLIEFFTENKMSWDERLNYMSGVQRDVYFPIIENMCNVRLNLDGSGVFLDGIDHKLNAFGHGVVMKLSHSPEYCEEGERIRCKLALDEAIKMCGDFAFLICDVYPAIYYYNGYARYKKNKKQVEIGSDEYNQLLDRMVVVARTCRDPDPSLCSSYGYETFGDGYHNVPPLAVYYPYSEMDMEMRTAFML